MNCMEDLQDSSRSWRADQSIQRQQPFEEADARAASGKSTVYV